VGIINIRHTGIVTDDLKKSLYFYRTLLGFKIKKRMLEKGSTTDKISNLKNVSVETIKLYKKKNQLIELLYYHSHRRSNKKKVYNISRIGISHISMTVNNLQKTYKKLKNKNIRFISKPNISDDGNVKITFCRAPEGTLIELVEEIDN
tara:strand:+ start:1104 stop:1547 length:444 start_codon:yes stop_codon:yes gene_type:complete